MSVTTSLPADSAGKGGSENAVKSTNADLVPTSGNLLPQYGSFEGLEAARASFS